MITSDRPRGKPPEGSESPAGRRRGPAQEAAMPIPRYGLDQRRSGAVL